MSLTSGGIFKRNIWNGGAFPGFWLSQRGQSQADQIMTLLHIMDVSYPPGESPHDHLLTFPPNTSPANILIDNDGGPLISYKPPQGYIGFRSLEGYRVGENLLYTQTNSESSENNLIGNFGARHTEIQSLVTSTTITFTATNQYWYKRFIAIPAGTYRINFDLQKVTIGNIINCRVATSSGTQLAVKQFDLTDGIKRRCSVEFTLTSSNNIEYGLDPRSFAGAGAQAGEYVFTKYHIERIDGLANQNPSEYIPVGVGVTKIAEQKQSLNVGQNFNLFAEIKAGQKIKLMTPNQVRISVGAGWETWNFAGIYTVTSDATNILIQNFDSVEHNDYEYKLYNRAQPSSGLEGFAYYKTRNGNTVDTNGVVTETAGADIPASQLGIKLETAKGNKLYAKTNDLTGWNQRGTPSVTLVTDGDGYIAKEPYSDIASLMTKAVSDIFYQVSGWAAPNTPSPLGFALRKISSSGVLDVANPLNNANGLWSVDLSLLSTGWEWITKDHPAVTEVNTFICYANNYSGVHFYTSDGPMHIQIQAVHQIDGPVLTTYTDLTSPSATNDVQLPISVFPYSVECEVKLLVKYDQFSLPGHQVGIFDNFAIYSHNNASDIASYDGTLDGVSPAFPQIAGAQDSTWYYIYLRLNAGTSEYQLKRTDIDGNNAVVSSVNDYDGSPLNIGTMLRLAPTPNTYKMMFGGVWVRDTDPGVYS